MIVLAGAWLGWFEADSSASIQKIDALDARVDFLSDILSKVYKVDMDTLNGAIGEGKLTIYTYMPVEPARELVNAFMEKYPFIQAEFFRQPSGGLFERLRADVARGQVQADIFQSPGVELALQGFQEGLFSEYVSPASDTLPQSMRTLEPKGYIESIGLIVPVYNTDKVSKEEAALLKSWENIVDPRWKGRMAITDPNALASAYTPFFTLWSMYGDEWVAKLAALEPKIMRSNLPAAEGVAAGEFDVAIHTENQAAERYEAGAPVGIVYPEPTVAYGRVSSVVKGAPHANAAKLFIEWSISPEGQRAWNEIYQTPVPHPAVRDARAFTEAPWYEAPKEFVIHPNPEELVERRDEFSKVWNTYFK